MSKNKDSMPSYVYTHVDIDTYLQIALNTLKRIYPIKIFRMTMCLYLVCVYSLQFEMWNICTKLFWIQVNIA